MHKIISKIMSRRLTFSVVLLFILLSFLGNHDNIYAQNVIRGTVFSEADGGTLIGANLIIKGTSTGTITDWDGTFSITTTEELPLILEVSYIGYETRKIEVKEFGRLTILLEEDQAVFETIEVRGSRILDRQREAPQTIQALDAIGIKQTPSSNFYEGLGSLPGVDMTTASLGFTIINTRGFNSTSPVRSLQIIDGVDNQAPGLNFSLGNFLGSSELDLQRVEIIQGASSAFYGPNAFNGVISMETKNPFFHSGLSAQVKFGERNLIETAIRWADVWQNNEGYDQWGYKLNLSYLRADDWVANNYEPVYGSLVDKSNPGGFDAVNIYGDEYRTSMDLTDAGLSSSFAGLGQWHRRGYKEEDLVDYDTRNFKGNFALYFRTQAEKGLESPELKWSSSYSRGTTVYQGDNRFSLKNIQFFQSVLDFSKRGKYFIRAYATVSDAGDSYDPYFTALRLQTRAKSNQEWSKDYTNFWIGSNGPRRWMNQNGYPQVEIISEPPFAIFDREGAIEWLANNQDSLLAWHQLAQENANSAGFGIGQDFFEPGTDRFNEAFNDITSKLNNDSLQGTRFYDRSALYHVHGEYKFNPTFTDKWVFGGNIRYYTPRSKGTIFRDEDESITNFEYGIYSGITKKFFDNKLSANITARVDKNQNFKAVFSPAASLVYQVKQGSFLRATFSSALRNPTLTDQFLRLNVGPAILSGNLNGVDSLITVESFNKFRNTLEKDLLEYFDIDPVRPEKVNTFELGYRTTLFDRLFVDAGYYFSIYNDFLGFNIGIEADFEAVTGLPQRLTVFRYSANSVNRVTTQGFSVGLNYYIGNYYQAFGNYSWNRLNSDIDDPIIPAYNTPEHKFNIGFSGREIPYSRDLNLGFNINYKWMEGFLFEGSPQFTGPIPSYGLLDLQINGNFTNYHTTIKVGASNILDNRVFHSYGGPRIGRMAYITLTYEFNKN